MLKRETIYIDKHKTIEALEKHIYEYVHYYNHKRMQLKLKRLSPVQYRAQSLVKLKLSKSKGSVY